MLKLLYYNNLAISNKVVSKISKLSSYILYYITIYLLIKYILLPYYY